MLDGISVDSNAQSLNWKVVSYCYDKVWNSQNPFDFMELISLRAKSNIFEVRFGEYKKSGVGKTEKDISFSIDNDF